MGRKADFLLSALGGLREGLFPAISSGLRGMQVGNTSRAYQQNVQSQIGQRDYERKTADELAGQLGRFYQYIAGQDNPDAIDPETGQSYSQMANPMLNGGMSRISPQNAQVLLTLRGLQQGNQGLSNVDKGQAPNFGSFTPLETSRPITEGRMKRRGDITDAKRTIDFLADMMDQQNMQNAKPGEPVMQTDPGMLSAQIGMSDLYNQDPYSIGVPDVGQGITYKKNEQDNTNAQFSNQTSRSHYERADATDRAVYEATKANQGGYARYAPVGGSGRSESPLVDLARVQGIYKDQLRVIDQEVKEMGTVIGKNGKSRPIMDSDQGYEQYRAKVKERDAMRKQFRGTFGGGQAQKIQQAGQNLGSKYGVSY